MTNNIREKQESVLQLHAQPAINQCPLDYKIRMNQYAYISELNKITMHIFRNVWLTVEKKGFLFKINGLHNQNDLISVVSLSNPKKFRLKI